MSDTKQKLCKSIVVFLVSPSHRPLLGSSTNQLVCQAALELLQETEVELLDFTPRQAREYIYRLSQPLIKQPELINTLTGISSWLNRLRYPDKCLQEIEPRLIWNISRCTYSSQCPQEIKTSASEISTKLIPYREMKSFTTEELRQILQINDALDDFLETGGIHPTKDVIINHLDWLNKNLNLN